jgi:hypothetical protein
MKFSSKNFVWMLISVLKQFCSIRPGIDYNLYIIYSVPIFCCNKIIIYEHYIMKNLYTFLRKSKQWHAPCYVHNAHTCVKWDSIKSALILDSTLRHAFVCGIFIFMAFFFTSYFNSVVVPFIMCVSLLLAVASHCIKIFIRKKYIFLFISLPLTAIVVRVKLKTFLR